MIVPCLHCQKPARLTTGKEIYPHRPDLFSKPIWKCDDCDATCGCHPGGNNPLGYPANKQTRNARMQLHNARLDPLWKSGPKKLRKSLRVAVYRHLSECMEIPSEKTHTGMFDIEQCRKAWKCLSQITQAQLIERLKA